MKLVDTHAHLDFPHLRANLEEVLAAARERDVRRIVTVGASRGLESNFRALAIAEAHDEIRCTAGIHPHDAGDTVEGDYETIASELARHEQVVAIGEIGLDYHYDNAPREVQREVFRRYCRLAADVGKPVVIHSREAEEDTLEIFEEEGVTGGIMHCFTGSREMAEACLERDFYISFSGIATFSSARELLSIAADVVPDDRILVETDSPFLAPEPHRGEKNQPAYVRDTAERIAEARGVTLEAFAAQTWDNACRVFDWPE
jgi:TatD DNase family protein